MGTLTKLGKPWYLNWLSEPVILADLKRTHVPPILGIRS